MAGPRGYSVGTDRALFDLAQGTCYYPDCGTPAIVFVENVPVTNVQIAHICGANPGSSRFDLAMDDEERASFDNLILLCKPHHDLVDRIDPHRFPADVLKHWKTDREGPGIAALRGLRGLTERRLEEMLEAAIQTAGPRREVVLEVAGGALLARQGGVATVPLDGWRTILDMNPSMKGPPTIVATARNTGGLLASIDSISIVFRLGPDGAQGELSLLGRNDFLALNPQLPARLDAGESLNWLTSLETVKWVVSQTARSGVEIAEFGAKATLGSGDVIASGWYAMALLPLP